MVERIGGIRDGLISSSRSKQSMIEVLGEKINWRWKGGEKNVYRYRDSDETASISMKV